MPNPERVPSIVGAVTLVAGTALAAAPRAGTGPLGLDGEERGMRAVGVADLVLVPGLLGARPRWPWMVGRAALSLMQATYLDGVAPRSSRPAATRAAAAVLLGLAVMDASTGLALRRLERA